MSNTKIEWTDKTWGVITGCDPISEGCANCYARRMAHRLAGRCGYPKDNPFAVTFHFERLNLPLRWKKPCKVFVNSMGDLLHSDVTDRMLDDVFGAMWACLYLGRGDNIYPGHIFQVLTKRPERMQEYLYFSRRDKWAYVAGNMSENGDEIFDQVAFYKGYHPRIWLGVTVENSKHKDRIDILRQIPAAVRFISFEPLLDDVGKLELTGIHWVIVGGETGPGAREMKDKWAIKIKDQCVDDHVPFFYKGQGTYEMSKNAAGTEYRRLDGRWWSEFPKVNEIRNSTV